MTAEYAIIRRGGKYELARILNHIGGEIRRVALDGRSVQVIKRTLIIIPFEFDMDEAPLEASDADIGVVLGVIQRALKGDDLELFQSRRAEVAKNIYTHFFKRGDTFPATATAEPGG